MSDSEYRNSSRSGRSYLETRAARSLSGAAGSLLGGNRGPDLIAHVRTAPGPISIGHFLDSVRSALKWPRERPRRRGATWAAGRPAAARRALAIAGAPGQERTRLIQLSAFSTNKHQLASELHKHSDRGNPFFGENRDCVLDAGWLLLGAAQSEDQVRDNLALEQVVDMVVAITQIHGGTRYVAPILTQGRT